MAGTITSCCSSHGYRVIRIDNQLIMAHRLAWLYVHGELPSGEIDHINGDRSDNRLANLRLATRVQNNQNTKTRTDNTSGHKGVCFHKQAGRWMAYINASGKRTYLGLHNSKEEAAQAYAAAAQELHGEFARTEQ